MPRSSPNRLVLSQQFALCGLVKAEYVVSALTDIDFAKLATERLGFSVVPSNVASAREAFSIISNRDLARQAPADEVAALRRRVEALEQRIEVYFKGCRKDAP